MAKKLRFNKRQTKKTLSELAFDSSEGSFKILADLGTPEFFELRAKELHMQMQNMEQDEKCKARKQLIQLLVMAVIEEEKDYGCTEAKGKARS